jgi:tellurite resistance protein TehA-like permease
MKEIYDFFGVVDNGTLYMFWFISCSIVLFGIYWYARLIRMIKGKYKEKNPGDVVGMAIGGFIIAGFIVGAIIAALWPILLFFLIVDFIGKSLNS